MAQRRLTQLLHELSRSPAQIGTLKLGDISFPVHESLTPSRLPHTGESLEPQDTINANNLYFILQKYILGQDVFFLSQPGPYARRLAMTFCRYAIYDPDLCDAKSSLIALLTWSTNTLRYIEMLARRN